jgi:hypothetical protein
LDWIVRSSLIASAASPRLRLTCLPPERIMLNLCARRAYGRLAHRTFLQVGSLGLGGLILADMLRDDRARIAELI